MRKILAIAGVAFTSMLVTGSAFAQGAPPPPPPAGAPANEPAPAGGGGDDDKKIGLGIEGQFMLPLGDFGDLTGPQIGPLVRIGYRVIPSLELTARTGYLFGLGKTQTILGTDISRSVSNIPIWVGARYFFMEPYAGLYGSAELAINLMSASGSSGGVSSSTGITREGFNLGAGYVISKELPIDIRAQFSMLNLLGKETNEPTFIALGLSAGYTFQF
jgi:hypothetical protein